MEMIEKETDDTQGQSIPKPRIHLIFAICWILISVGAASLLISIISVSQILAFIGLSLIFWGGILFYIKPEGYAKQVLLDAAMPPTFETLDQIINELGYKGKAIYLPSKYLQDPETYKAYLPKLLEEKPPEPNIILKQEHQLFLKNPEGILFTPPGAQLAKLFEKRLGINFSLVNLNYIKRNLPKLFIEDLEIADNLEIDIEFSSKSLFGIKKTNYGLIYVTITNSLFKNIIKENPKLSKISNTVGSPISSAIACVLTKTTGKPVIIEDVQSSENGNIIRVTFRIEKLEYTEPFQVKTEPVSIPIAESITVPITQKHEIQKSPQSPIVEIPESIIPTINVQRSIGLTLILLGVITIVWIGVLTWNDVFEFNKDLGVSLLAYRIGEPIGLGIGMKFIHYFMIGSVLILSGILAYIQKGKKILDSFIRPPIIPRLFDLSLMLLGALIIVWITELIVFELVVYNKNLIFILFAYGTNTPLSLGIGMNVIYYLMIGLALLLSGALSYLQRNKTSKTQLNVKIDKY